MVVPSSAIAAPPAGTALPTICGAGCTPDMFAFRNVSDAVPVTIRTASGAPPLASVVTADVICTNGIVHVISNVLVPSAGLTPPIPTANVVATATSAGLTSLVAALTATGLDTVLSTGNGIYTVFAPTNAAMALVPTYISSNVTLLTQVLLYHVKSARTYSTNLPNNVNATVPTLNGQSLKVLRVGAAVTVFGAASTATVTTADVDSTNAVVHVIDTVLLPAGLPAPPASVSRSPSISPSRSPTSSVASAVTATATRTQSVVPSSTPGVVFPSSAAQPSGTLQVQFTINFNVASVSTFTTVASSNAGVGRTLREGLFKAAVETTGSNKTSDYLGLTILTVNGAAPNPSVNARLRQLQTNVPITVALLIAPSGGAANTAEANRLAGLITTQLLTGTSPVLIANLRATSVAFAANGAPFTSPTGAGAASVVDPSPAASGGNSNTGAVVGGVVGGVAVLGALAGLAVYWRRRKSAGEYEALALKNADNPYAAQRSYS